MNAVALHFPEHRGVARWAFAAFVVGLAHAAIIAVIAVWYLRSPPAPNIIPAIAITYAPFDSTAQAPEDQRAIGTPQDQIDAPPPEPPKLEKTIEPMEPIEKLLPSPPQPAEVTLPKPAEQAKEKPVEQRPPQEARVARAKNDALQVASIAASSAYNALVAGHLRKFIRAGAARFGSGKTQVEFVLDREGRVLNSKIDKSSGNAALDREALAIIDRANPFPPFPAMKLGERDSFNAPIEFQRH
jgi:protein TonB